MKKLFLLMIILFVSAGLVYSERYEPLLGKSGSVIDLGGIRFPLGWGYSDLKNPNKEESLFNFGLDIGIGLRTELQNRVDYDSSDDEWKGWTELLKIRISEVRNGPAIGIGLGARIPLHAPKDNLGIIAGLYISSAIKDIDFDFNIGVNPFITYKETGVTIISNKVVKIKKRNHYVNFNILLGKKILPFLKIAGGFEMLQYFGGQKKIGDNDPTNLGKGSSWAFLLGFRLKPVGYPILLDNSVTFGTGNENDLNFKYQIGLQILPQSPNADW